MPLCFDCNVYGKYKLFMITIMFTQMLLASLDNSILTCAYVCIDHLVQRYPVSW